MTNIYKFRQMLDDGEENYETHTAIVLAEDVVESRRLLNEQDSTYPRCAGWLDAVVEKIGWSTGEYVDYKGLICAS